MLPVAMRQLGLVLDAQLRDLGKSDAHVVLLRTPAPLGRPRPHMSFIMDVLRRGRFECGDGWQTWRSGYRDRELKTRLGATGRLKSDAAFT